MPRRSSSRTSRRVHPDAEGKPVVIANCQAGWQIMMMAAINPNRTGPIMLAGSPLSYWAGVHGKNPHALSGRHAGRHLADRACRAIWATASSTAPIWSPTSNR